MFEVGTLVTGKINDVYGVTNDNALCIVTNEINDYPDDIKVKLIATTDEINFSDIGKSFSVKSEYFKEISVGKYVESHSTARFINHIELAKDNNIAERISEIVEQIKDAEKAKEEERQRKIANAYHLSDEERKNLRDEITTLLNTYDYHPTDKGIDAIIDEWSINKASLIRLFQNHPNYNGKYQITFDTDFEREIDKDKANDFYKWALKTYVKSHDYVIDGVPCKEARRKRKICNNICDYIREIMDLLNDDEEEKNYELVVIDGHTFDFFEDEYRRYDQIVDKYHSEPIRTVGDYVLTNSDWQKYDWFDDIYRYTRYNSPFINDEFADAINRRFPIKAVSGQKLSRVINKLCHYLGIDKDKDYNKEFAKFSDAVNPLTIKRHTVISVHPVDYLTMSFGNSWSSCHTIDKKNIRCMDNSYYGMYSGGTMSYMLDETSVVFYTVDGKYDGNELELEPKINRNMFHIGEEKLIQGRVYPQTNDDKNSIYEQFRNIMQKVIADCMGKPNMWKLKRGTVACEDVIESKGVHYRDYENFEDCNVSYLKLDDDTYNENRITVGHEQICPCCGEVHTREKCIECDYCYYC